MQASFFCLGSALFIALQEHKQSAEAFFVSRAQEQVRKIYAVKQLPVSLCDSPVVGYHYPQKLVSFAISTSMGLKILGVMRSFIGSGFRPQGLLYIFQWSEGLHCFERGIKRQESGARRVASCSSSFLLFLNISTFHYVLNIY